MNILSESAPNTNQFDIFCNDTYNLDNAESNCRDTMNNQQRT